MAQATYSVQTGASDLSGYRRKIQAGVYKAVQYGVEELQILQRTLKKLNVVPSQREVTFELDILPITGAAAIPEGGKEARPSMPNTVTATISWIFINKRATISRTTEIINKAFGTRANLVNDLKWYGMQFARAIAQRHGDMFYGFSTGTLAKVTSISTDDVVLKDMYGIAGLGATTHNRQVVDFFTAGTAPNVDYVAFLNPSGPALRTSGIAAIDTITRSTNTITGSAFSDVSTVTANDLVVFANNVENTTMAGGTERSQNWVGLLDGATSTSVHSVSGGTYSGWNASTNDSTGGRLTGVRLMKLRQNIQNKGGGTMNLVILAQGVKFDLISQAQAGLRFGDAYAMEVDGDIKMKGVEFFSSRRTPDGYCFGLDKNDSVHPWMIVPNLDEEDVGLSWDDAYKLQDDSASLFGVDHPSALVWTNRANIGVLSGLTQV